MLDYLHSGCNEKNALRSEVQEMHEVSLNKQGRGEVASRKARAQLTSYLTRLYLNFPAPSS